MRPDSATQAQIRIVKTSEPKIFNVLFLCTGNSARSILAEAILNYVCGRGKFRAFSAGSHPKDRPNPYAIQLLKEQRIPIEGLRSKSWDEFARPDSPPLDFVITVCDRAAGEQCPFWPGQPISAHWGLPDPAEVEGSEEQKRKAFADALLTLRRRIELFTSLPIRSLDRMALQERMRDIGLQ
jgi:arsenate reductase